MQAKAKAFVAMTVVVLSGVSLVSYYYWQHSGRPGPAPVQVQVPPPSAPPPPVRQVIEVPPAVTPLPQLAASDSFVLDELAGLIGNKSLMGIFHTDRLIRNIVATVDNLPGREAPLRVAPVRQPGGKFLVADGPDGLVISPENAARYSLYTRLAEAIDTKKLAGLYVRLYPLFQQAYEELGYPRKYFNDRLLTALDNLLAAPDISGPVKLVQPKVFYLYADPEMEGRSIGQRIMMRMGSKNEAILKARLGAFRQELLLHMHEQKVERAEMPASSAKQPEQQ